MFDGRMDEPRWYSPPGRLVGWSIRHSNGRTRPLMTIMAASDKEHIGLGMEHANNMIAEAETRNGEYKKKCRKLNTAFLTV